MIAMVLSSAEYPGFAHTAIIAECRQHEEGFAEGFAQRESMREQGRRGQIEHHEIRLLARQEITQLRLEIECSRTPQGGQIPALQR